MFPNPNPNPNPKPDPDPTQPDSGEPLEMLMSESDSSVMDSSVQTIEVPPPEPIMYYVRPSRISYPIFGRDTPREYEPITASPLQRRRFDFVHSSTQTSGPHSYGPLTPSPLPSSHSYVLPSEPEGHPQFSAIPKHAGSHLSPRKSPVKKPYTPILPSSKQAFQFPSPSEQPGTSGMARAGEQQSQSKARQSPTFQFNQRISAFDAQFYDPSGEHGIEPPLPPIPARAMPLFTFSGETEQRPTFFEARAAEMRAMQEEQMEISPRPEQEDEENM